MKGLRRNQRVITYRAYLSCEDAKDDCGGLTTEKKINYAPPVSIAGSVLPAGSYASQQMFGTSLDYESAVVTHERNLPIREVDLMQIDGVDYAIRRIARNLNTTAIAVRRVDIRDA